MIGWYYLHTDGSLIFKRELGDTAADLRESDFVVMMWPFDQTRESAARVVVEGLAAGAAPERVFALAELWGFDDIDLTRYARHIGAAVDKDGDAWCAMPPGFKNLAESPAGFGDTVLEALADLARAVGFRPQKLWGESLQDALRRIGECHA